MIKHAKIIIIVTYLLTPGCISNKPTPAPSDNELIIIFKNNREVFNQLVTSIQKDGYFIVSSDPKWSNPEHIPLDKKKRYYDLLQQVRERGDWETWLEFFLTGIKETSEQAAGTARQIWALFEADRERIERLGRAATSALRLHQYLRTKPIISIPGTAADLGISAPTLAKSARHLQQLGILREITEKKRGRLFVYSRYLDILSEGTEPL